MTQTNAKPPTTHSVQEEFLLDLETPLTPERKPKAAKTSAANLGFEQKLWLAADKMRGHMDPSEYKHVALGLIFLKYISDAFEERHAHLLS